MRLTKILSLMLLMSVALLASTYYHDYERNQQNIMVSENCSILFLQEYAALSHSCINDVNLNLICSNETYQDSEEYDNSLVGGFTSYEHSNIPGIRDKAEITLYYPSTRISVAHELFHVYQYCSHKFENDVLLREMTASLYSVTRSNETWEYPFGYSILIDGLNRTEHQQLLLEILAKDYVTLDWVVDRKNYYVKK